jgi:hypothetical protein
MDWGFLCLLMRQRGPLAWIYEQLWKKSYAWLLGREQRFPQV